MNSLYLFVLYPAKPGALQVKNQIMGNMVVMIVFSEMKSYSWKDVPVRLHLKA